MTFLTRKMQNLKKIKKSYKKYTKLLKINTKYEIKIYKIVKKEGQKFTLN